MDLRQLPDLELAALVGVMFEMTLNALAECTCPAVFVAASEAAVREVLYRRRGVPAPARLFDAQHQVPLHSLRAVRALARHGAEQLEQEGFAAASALLFACIEAEIPVDATAAVPNFAQAELRTLN